MTSHDPDSLRRIMLLLKGKKKAGRALSKQAAKSTIAGVMPAHKGYNDDGTPDYHSPGITFKGSTRDPNRQQFDMGMVQDDPYLLHGRPNRDSELKEIELMLQLLDSGQEAKKKLKARGVGR